MILLQDSVQPYVGSTQEGSDSTIFFGILQYITKTETGVSLFFFYVTGLTLHRLGILYE